MELIDSHRQLGDLLAAEKQGRVEAWQNAGVSVGKDSVTARDRVAEFNIVPLAKDIVVLKGEIAALIEERDYITLLLTLPAKD